MRKTISISTLAAVAIAGATMLFAGFGAPLTSATPSICHAAKPSIVAPTTAARGTTITVTGSEGQALGPHSVKTTLQSRLSTSKKWVNGKSGSLAGDGSYALKWKAPTKKGKYKIRVRVVNGSESNTTVVKTVTVK